MSKRGWVLFLAMAVIWGLPYMLIRVAVREVNPGVIVLARTAPAALLLLPIVLVQRKVPVLRENVKWIAIFAIVEFGIPWYLMSSAEEHLTSSLTSLLVCCVPLLAVVAQRFRKSGEHVSRRRLVGLGIGAIGVAFLVGLDVRGGSIGPLLMMLGVCVGYTIGPIILATRLAHVPGVVVVAAVDGPVDRRQRAADPRGGVVEEHRVVDDTLAQLGQHVLQNRGPRADQREAAVAEVLPYQRVGAQRQGVVLDDVVGRRGGWGLHELRHAKQCYRFRTLYQWGGG